MEEDRTMDQLIQEAAAGSKDAMHEIVSRTSDSVNTLARKCTGSEELAREAVKTAYIKAFRNLDSLGDTRHFKRWLELITARNAYVIAKPAETDYFYEAAGSEERELTEEETEIYAETAAIAEEMIRDLAPPVRNCINMYYLDGFDEKEIAAVMDSTPDQVTAVIYRARNALKKKSEELGKMGYGIS